MAIMEALDANGLEDATLLMGSWASNGLRRAVNITQFAPFAKDLLLAGPRVGRRLGSYFMAVPEAVDGVINGRLGSHMIPDATGAGTMDSMQAAGTAAATAAAGLIHSTEAVSSSGIDAQASGFASRVSMESVRGFGNVFAYMTSRWACACLVMVVVLNRTVVYASPRRNISFGWKLRLCLRAIPLILFGLQIPNLLQSIHCQTSPDFAMMRWGNSSKSAELLFIQNGGFLHQATSLLLFQPTDEQSCLAVDMITQSSSDSTSRNIRGSFSRLWPAFQTICLSQFVETLICSLHGRPVGAETSMTVFEHSLAFAEAEAYITHALGWGIFGGRTSNNTRGGSETSLSRPIIMQKVNTPPEVLLIAVFSCLSHFTSHVLGIFNAQSRFRLLSTGLWAMCYMSAISSALFGFSFYDASRQNLLRYPIVCIIGFIPHILVLAGILSCTSLYGLAVILTALASPRQPTQSFMSRLTSAHQNMQAGGSLSSMRIAMHMDFYQALLKCGYTALTIASEAVYLHESTDVRIASRTWVEEDRLREFVSSIQPHNAGASFSASGRESDESGLVAYEDEKQRQPHGTVTSGFALERIPSKKRRLSVSHIPRDGVGATERSRRWVLVVLYFTSIGRLVISWAVVVVVKTLSRLGLRRSSRWLKRVTASSDRQATEAAATELTDARVWLVDGDGKLKLSKDDNVDIEMEMRRRIQNDRQRWDYNDDEELETSLYAWFVNGGWWGGRDDSGNYAPPLEAEDDATSIISTDTTSDGGWQSDDDDRTSTPTPKALGPALDGGDRSYDNPLTLDELAGLLHPRNAEQRAQAESLAAHLQSDSIMTRARFRRLHEIDRSKVLTSTKDVPPHLVHARSTRKLTPDEEAEILEYLITTRRAATAGLDSQASQSWTDGAAGFGDSGPQCVVCQSAPRNIIVWPCRCLSLCDDCRVTLAMKSFVTCVCCRRDVSSFSRIFVP